METYIACACELKKGSARRRKLYSLSTCHLLPILQDLCKERYSCKDVDRLLPSVESGRSDKEESYLCMKCFRELEKLSRLRKGSALVEESLKDGLEKVAQLRQLPVKTTPSRRKRPAISTSPSQPATKRQRGLDTPTRKSLQQIQESGTPSVSVSMLYNYSLVYS